MTNFSKVQSMWLTWHFQARSRNLAKSLNVPIYEYVENDNLIKRHLFSSLWTIKILLTKRPDKIIIQNSFMLLLIVSVYKILRFNKVVLIVDCHTKSLRRKAPGVLNFIFWPLKKFSFKHADLTIISNEGLIDDISELHNNFLILPDKIPEERKEIQQSKNENYCVYISSFHIDEPFEEVLEASEILKNKIKIYWTGKYYKNAKVKKENYQNSEFTGYMTFPDYYKLIGNADCLLALTTEEDCLQSGAYEALNMEVPFVISDTKALRQYFQESAIYTKHKPQDIAEAILTALDKKERIKKNIVNIKTIRNKEFDEKVAEIKNLIKN